MIKTPPKKIYLAKGESTPSQIETPLMEFLGGTMGSWKNIFFIVVIIALVVRILAALISLENYRYANSHGFCNEFDTKDAVARVLKDQCLDETMEGSDSLWLLYKAIF